MTTTKPKRLKGAIMFTLTFFCFISYLYSLPMKTMTISEMRMSFKAVWRRATEFQIEESQAKLIMEPLCVRLIGWFFTCCGKERPMSFYLRNYAFETWLVYIIAYLFILVWCLLEIFEAYGNKNELRKLIEERLWRLRSESSSEIELADSQLHTEIAAQSNEIKSAQPFIEISSIVHLPEKPSDEQVVETSNDVQLTEGSSTNSGQLTQVASEVQLTQVAIAVQLTHGSNARTRKFNQVLNDAHSQKVAKRNAEKSFFSRQRRALSESDIFEFLNRHPLSATCSQITDAKI